MEYAISIPQHFADEGFDPDHFRSYLTRVEELGFSSAWTAEQVLGTAPQLSPLGVLAYAAACNKALRLGVAALVSPLHNPVQLAKNLASLDQLSRGRLEVGIVGGGPFRMFSAFEVDPSTYIARFNEGVELMRKLWSEPRTTFTGRFWQLEHAPMEPKPFQKPGPRIWIGGLHRDALRRAARLGDGFMGAGISTTAEYVQQVRIVREALEAQGRDPATFPIAKRVYIAVDDDAARARQHISDALQVSYGHLGWPDLVSLAVAGTPEDCIMGLREVIDAGAQLVLLDHISPDIEQAERLAREVIPRTT